MDDATDADALKFAELLETFGLIQHINFATHVYSFTHRKIKARLLSKC